jgi:hypothetical protein
VNQERGNYKRWEVKLTIPEIREMLEIDGKLEGHWAIEVDVPTGTDPFAENKLWLQALNTLTESCGVKITTVRFNLRANVAGYEFRMKEE